MALVTECWPASCLVQVIILHSVILLVAVYCFPINVTTSVIKLIRQEYSFAKGSLHICFLVKRLPYSTLSNPNRNFMTSLKFLEAVLKNVPVNVRQLIVTNKQTKNNIVSEYPTKNTRVLGTSPNVETWKREIHRSTGHWLVCVSLHQRWCLVLVTTLLAFHITMPILSELVYLGECI